jgi:hypothetical protein
MSGEEVEIARRFIKAFVAGLDDALYKAARDDPRVRAAIHAEVVDVLLQAFPGLTSHPTELADFPRILDHLLAVPRTRPHP